MLCASLFFHHLDVRRVGLRWFVTISTSHWCRMLTSRTRSVRMILGNRNQRRLFSICFARSNCTYGAVDDIMMQEKYNDGHDEITVTASTATSPLVSVGKLLASKGLCSRHEGERFHHLGQVLLGNRVLGKAELYVHPRAPIKLTPRAQRVMDNKITVILHKPMHYLTCQSDKKVGLGTGERLSRSLLVPSNFWSCQPYRARLCVRNLDKLVPAGRLDAESTGLLVFTQDGRIAAHIVGGTEDRIPKEYIVEVDVTPSENLLTLLRSGLSLDGRELLPARVRLLPATLSLSRFFYPGGYAIRDGKGASEETTEGSRFLLIELVEGRHRQIRRMCDLVGLRVLHIHRIRVGKVSLGSLPLGQWRVLASTESFV